MKIQNYRNCTIWALTLLLLIGGCKKTDFNLKDTAKLANEKSVISQQLEDNSFFFDGELPATVSVLMDYIRNENDQYQYAEELKNAVGIPVWEHAQIIPFEPELETIDNAVVLVPLVPFEAQHVTAFIVATVSGTEVNTLKLIRGNHYGAYGWGGNEPLNAERVALKIMEFDHQLFGTSYFTISDKRLFGLEHLTLVSEPLIHLEPDPLSMRNDQPCFHMVLRDLDGNTLDDINPNPLQIDCPEIWITVTGGAGWGGGGGGGNGGGNNGGGSGSGSGGGDWYNQPCMENQPSVPPPPGYSYPRSCTDEPVATPFLPPLTFTPLYQSNEPGENMPNEAEDNYWDDNADFDVTIEEQEKPTYKALFDAYPFIAGQPGKELPVPELCTLIGGEVKDVFDQGDVSNGCALRLSRALNYAGVEIPEIPGKTWKGADNKNYFFRAEHMKTFLTKTFGSPDTAPNIHLKAADAGVNGAGFASKLTGKKGIYLMRPKDRQAFGASGHATLYNIIDCLGGHNFFPAAEEVFLWVLN